MITKEMVYALAEALDPDHQGEAWPDPIAWDGRPLQEQAEDLLVLADEKIADSPFFNNGRKYYSARIRTISIAAHAVRTRGLK